MFRRQRRNHKDEPWNTLTDSTDFYGDSEETLPRKRRKGCLVWVALASILLAGIFLNARTRRSTPTEALSPIVTQTEAAIVARTTDENTITVTPRLAQTSIPEPAVTFLSPSLPSAADNYDPDALGQMMLGLVNEEREKAGMQAVVWDPFAAEVGRLHAEDMVTYGYFSHWNREGLGPDHRYSLAGGYHAVFENLHAYTYTYGDGRGAPIEDWSAVIANAHSGLMESPGHRANILDPAHTHLGIGMAYASETGQFRLAQEFTNQYVFLTELIPDTLKLGDSFWVAGNLSDTDIDELVLSLSFEPYPVPMSVDQLNRTGLYTSPAIQIWGTQLQTHFEEPVYLPNDLSPGVYHCRIFSIGATAQVLLVDRAIWITD